MSMTIPTMDTSSSESDLPIVGQKSSWDTSNSIAQHIHITNIPNLVHNNKIDFQRKVFIASLKHSFDFLLRHPQIHRKSRGFAFGSVYPSKTFISYQQKENRLPFRQIRQSEQADKAKQMINPQIPCRISMENNHYS